MLTDSSENSHVDPRPNKSSQCPQCSSWPDLSLFARRCVRRRSGTDEQACRQGPAIRRARPRFSAVTWQTRRVLPWPMFACLTIPGADMRFVDSSTPHRQLEAKTNTKGDYRLELSGITKPTTISIDAMKPGYRRLVGTLMSGGDPKSVEVAPGTTAEAALILKPALYFAGVVVDQDGKPIPGVTIAANAPFARGSAGVERTATSSDGSFELFNYSVKQFDFPGASKGIVSFFHPDYINTNTGDIYAWHPRSEKLCGSSSRGVTTWWAQSSMLLADRFPMRW